MPRPSRQKKIADDGAAETPRLHRGDIMSPATRSAVMSRIRGSDTGPERIVAALLEEAGINCERQVRELPGRPDFVLREARIAVFVDGDFWHGRHFERWRLKLSEKWEAKIAATIGRDRRNRSALRRDGWRVVRLWESQLEADPKRCLRRVKAALANALTKPDHPPTTVAEPSTTG